MGLQRSEGALHCLLRNKNETPLWTAIFIMICSHFFNEVTQWQEIQCPAPSHPPAASSQRVRKHDGPFAQHETVTAAREFGEGERAEDRRQSRRAACDGVSRLSYGSATSAQDFFWCGGRPRSVPLCAKSSRVCVKWQGGCAQSFKHPNHPLKPAQSLILVLSSKC